MIPILWCPAIWCWTTLVPVYHLRHVIALETVHRFLSLLFETQLGRVIQFDSRIHGQAVKYSSTEIMWCSPKRWKSIGLWLAWCREEGVCIYSSITLVSSLQVISNLKPASSSHFQVCCSHFSSVHRLKTCSAILILVERAQRAIFSLSPVPPSISIYGWLGMLGILCHWHFSHCESPGQFCPLSSRQICMRLYVVSEMANHQVGSCEMKDDWQDFTWRALKRPRLAIGWITDQDRAGNVLIEGEDLTGALRWYSNVYRSKSWPL